MLHPLIQLALYVQVHDEVILEGPKESAKEAQDLVVKHMNHPWEWAADGEPVR
jgi:DNA polymerase I-like protein with 3'-5' exonuclease and polymerase domains